MNWLNTIALLLVAYLAVFISAYCASIRHFFAASIDFLPPLMVYIGLTGSLVPLAIVAVAGGMMHDALSANPLGLSVLPLFGAGFVIHWKREVILREEPYAHFVLGTMASAAVPAAALLLLLAGGYKPVIGFGTLWQWGVMALVGGAVTPLLFVLLRRMEQAFRYPKAAEISFRPDREIRHGRFRK